MGTSGTGEFEKGKYWGVREWRGVIGDVRREQLASRTSAAWESYGGCFGPIQRASWGAM